MTNTMRNVPKWAQVPKAEYRNLRNELRSTADAASFAFIGVWNLMIEQMEERHALVAKGRRKTELTLAQAVKDMQKTIIQERAKMMEEEAEAESLARAQAFAAAKAS